ncbi:homoserine dehydrogenase [Campylobacter subantarcticus LMG 24377]|uniref:Homoserine dehydrogenase n=2 Tax=Campylobacter subantarcticus TaxID=497724 RepID=A0A0A8HBR9_9BACT|nr:homoserine dehydrogenase [Campylobacter subantarcticus]EAJ1260984.1 homoserine dehydrogenase [Campylobacter lari]AJC91422.1 homoserine dehydrogenase [Campylobacter subantarcticus LMG 24374]AJC93189.1 homoserine dehydrogenase [Campylobacter subantarcticus LMG 24377]EAJ1262104.1 homoserine dehydrogenase [Campylobacter lari]EAL3938759.1 homoserine dehydrogenase [Campylobacter lari]
MKIAILGYGTVGSAVVETLLKNQELIKARCDEEIIPVVALARSVKLNALIPVVNDIDEILNRDDIDVFVELMGGIELPFELISKILQRKKAVVTANKALLAYHRYELEKLAQNTAFGYEASVAGGIPIIKILKEGLSANNIVSIKGILNGTSNYILSKMTEDNAKFQEVLKKAQDLGYAEVDPAFDIEGFDAAHKLLILANIAYGLRVKPEDILIEGVSKVSDEDIYFAKEFEYTIKHLGIAKIKEGKIELRSHPAMLSKDRMLAKVDGVMNAISVDGDILGESLYYGPGAGGKATASAVIADLIDIARKEKNSAIFGYLNDTSYKLLEKDSIYTRYYLRLKVLDKIGVLSKITQLMSKHQISIDTFLQKPKKEKQDYSTLFFITHQTYEKNIQVLIQKLQEQEFVQGDVFMMRIED